MIKFKWIFRILPLIWMVAIWIMSSMPSDAIVELPALSVDHFIKESLHLVEFAIVYWFLVGAMLTTREFTPVVSLICALIAGFYGITDEIHQSFVPYRSCTVIDGVKDWIGVGVSWYVVRRAYFGGRFTRVGNLLRRFQGYFLKI